MQTLTELDNTLGILGVVRKREGLYLVSSLSDSHWLAVKRWARNHGLMWDYTDDSCAYIEFRSDEFG